MHAPGGTWLGYPKGVFLLSFTELWERFSYYGMLALLVLFLTADVADHGFGWERGDALKLYGFYTGLIFTAPLLGGWIANNYWGERRCLFVGGVLLVCGHFCLAGPALLAAELGQDWVRGTFFGGLFLIAAGTALLKPTVSSIVGRFYEDGDSRRDRAFALFFVGIYLGGLSANFVVGYLGERVGWHWGFSAAGFGMTLGLIVYALKQREWLADLGVAPVKESRAGALLANVSPEERDRIRVILIQGLFTVAYAAAFYQKGGLLTLFARENLNRGVGGWEIPVTWFLTISTATFIVITPIVARVVRPAATKLAWGLIAIGIGYVVISLATRSGATDVWWGWLVITYLFFGLGDALVWPTQISMVSRLAPRNASALFVGGWYVTIGLGSWLTGYIGALGFSWGMLPVFTCLAITTFGLGLLLWSLAPRLKRMAHGAAE